MNDPIATAQRRVLGWCSAYTLGLPTTDRDRRIEEISCDILDQAEWALRRSIPPRRVSVSLQFRALRGIASDLSWRLSMQSRVESWGVKLMLTLLVVVVTTFLLAIDTVAVVRLSLVPLAHFEAVFLISSASIALAALPGGLLFFSRARTRSLGLLWLAVGSQLTLFISLRGLAATSTSLNLYASSVTWLLSTCLGAAGLLTFFAAALAWLRGNTSAGADTHKDIQ